MIPRRLLALLLAATPLTIGGIAAPVTLSCEGELYLYEKVEERTTVKGKAPLNGITAVVDYDSRTFKFMGTSPITKLTEIVSRSVV